MSSRKTFDITLNIDDLRKQKPYFIVGKKGTYLDLKVIEMENKEYNDFVVVRKTTKKEYDDGIKGDIVGYGKDWDLRNGNDTKSRQPTSQPEPEGDDDLPF